MTSVARRALPRGGLLGVLSKAAVIAVLAGAAGSLGLMLYAGRNQNARILLLLFAVWVLSPFLAAIFANALSKPWSVFTRVTLNVVMLVFALGSLAIYGDFALGYPKAKAGFVFLVVPLASWLLIVIVVPIGAFLSGTRSPRGR